MIGLIFVTSGYGHISGIRPEHFAKKLMGLRRTAAIFYAS
jgi:hypothetical protein